jgi:MoxR-like ATPase
MSHFVLVDEINRATPKTQSALLEAMQEGQLTVGRETLVLPRPHFFIATQNPIEHQGTYPLPEAQLDRFLAKLHVGYPANQDYLKIIARTTCTAAPQAGPVLDCRTILEMQQTVRLVEVPDAAVHYAVAIVRATQPQCSSLSIVKEHVLLGASPRAVQSMIMLGKVHALNDHRTGVSLADIKAAAGVVLSHRIMMAFSAVARGIRIDEVVQAALGASK